MCARCTGQGEAGGCCAPLLRGSVSGRALGSPQTSLGEHWRGAGWKMRRGKGKGELVGQTSSLLRRWNLISAWLGALLAVFWKSIMFSSIVMGKIGTVSGQQGRRETFRVSSVEYIYLYIQGHIFQFFQPASKLAAVFFTCLQEGWSSWATDIPFSCVKKPLFSLSEDMTK